LDQHDVAVVEDLTTDGRRPDFAWRCTAETPERSMLSVRLSLQGRDRRAMNLYAERPGRFEDLDVDVATVFAAFVALSVQLALHEQRVAHLEAALQTNRQIGRAMGILMARRLVTSDEAFELLRQASQHLNRKLYDVAAEVNRTGRLPEVRRADHDVE
jgi:GAF domain-containing protein